MPTDTHENQQNVLVGQLGQLGQFFVFVPGNPQPEQAGVWHFGQEQAPPDTNGTGYNITLVTPMHEVKFNDALWDKLDRLSARTPDPYAEEDDDQ